MQISDVTSLVGGAALGAPFSELLKLIIAEAKKVKDFKSLSQDLASTMESLVPLLKEVDLMQEGLDPGEGELKDLIKTMRNAEEIIRKCSRIRWYNIAKKVLYTREIKGIKQDVLRFCQIKLQVIQYKNHLHFVRSMASVPTKIDLLSDRGNEFTELCLEPQPEEATIFWLERPLRELKKILFENGMVTIVVSAPSACGKTTLVTKLCHDADVKGKFKQVFFISLSKTPNVRLIIQRLVWHTSGIVNEIENELDARLCIKQLLKKLQQCGPILLVLDDARREEESLLEKIMFQFPHCKLLVTSRFEFPRLGPTYHLEPLIDEDVKNLFIDCVPLPNCLSCAKRDDLLQKMLKRCNGIPLAFNPLCSSMCDGCNSAIKDGISVNVLGGVWHPECFCCLVCHKPIAIHEFSNSEGKFHKSCYKKHHLPNSYVCKEKIPSNAEGVEYNEHPFCLEYNEHPFWLEKESGKKCIMLSAMSLSIIWGDTPQYWQWIPIPETRYHKVAELMDVCWFEIRGRLYTRGLSPRTRYSAYIVFKRANQCYGFENVAIEAGVGVVGEEATRRLIGFGQNGRRGRGRRNLVKPEEREDGWMEIELGDFVSEGGLTNSGEIEMSVLETKQLHWKRGLIIQGIEIRPSKIQ